MRALKKMMYLLGTVAAALYILNPGAGIFELLPDQLPLVGNLDEAAMVTLLIACLRGLRAQPNKEPAPALEAKQAGAGTNS